MVEKGRKGWPLADARNETLLNQSEFGEVLGITPQTVVRMEKHPEKITLERLGKWYQAVPAKGKAMIEQYLSDFFVA